MTWIENQESLSHSVRVVVREYIKRHGFGDATCPPVSVGRPSRVAPSKPEVVWEETPQEEPEAKPEEKPVEQKSEEKTESTMMDVNDFFGTDDTDD